MISVVKSVPENKSKLTRVKGGKNMLEKFNCLKLNKKAK